MNKLQHGDYCEVTREQAVELLTIEGYSAVEKYISEFFDGSYEVVYIRVNVNVSCILSAMKHFGFKEELTFPEFKERLVNTVKG